VELGERPARRGEELRPLAFVALAAAGEDEHLTVADGGVGVSPEHQERLFEPFFTTKPGGTGLGLVIVKKIVEEHGGEVAIANVTPRGARVTITLPSAAHRAAAKSAA